MIFVNHEYPDHWLDRSLHDLPRPYLYASSGYTPYDHIYLWLETNHTGCDEPVSGFDWAD